MSKGISRVSLVNTVLCDPIELVASSRPVNGLQLSGLCRLGGLERSMLVKHRRTENLGLRELPAEAARTPVSAAGRGETTEPLAVAVRSRLLWCCSRCLHL